VLRAHDLAERIEREIAAAVPGSAVFTHVEPLEDPASYLDTSLERTE
jgi:divalent metal cation (Fe/Co/Zn/Cd) transporter